jgi:transposase InsO family protein
MLSDQRLKKIMDELRLGDEAREVIRQIRQSGPSRRVDSGKHNVACRYPSKKMGWMVQAESHTNELAAIYVWDHDEITHEFYDQPPKIKLTYLDKYGKRRAHYSTPDFFIIQENFIGWVECKEASWLQNKLDGGSTLYQKLDDGTWVCPPGNIFAQRYGLSFKLRSSDENDWIFIRNVAFLSDYLDEQWPPVTRYDADQVLAHFEGKSWVLLDDLVNGSGKSEADIVNKLIADKELYVDLHKDLLAEPRFAKVFRDEITAKAIHTQIRSNQKLEPIQLPLLHPVRMIQGEIIEWDGAPFTIKAVGNTSLFLENPRGHVADLNFDQLRTLVSKGAIRGLPISSEEIATQIQKIIAKAGPADLARALQRQMALENEQRPISVSNKVPAVSERTLRHWKQLRRKGEQIYRDGFVGLISKICNRGNRNRKIDENVIAVMKVVIEEQLCSPIGMSIAVCYGHLRNACKEKGLVPPSEKTFRAEIKKSKSRYVLTEERQGERAAYKHSPFYWKLENSTPRHGDRVFEIGHIDHTEMDLQFVGRNFGEKLDKAWLTVLLDAYSRMVLAFVLTFDPPSYRSCMLVLKECVKRHGRVPSNIVVDKGKEFGSIYFETLLARLKSAKKTRPAQKPRFGSVIERFFGISNEYLVHNLMGNNKPLQNPREMSSTHDPRELAVWTLEEFTPRFAQFAYEVYAGLEHSALGVSPQTAYSVSLAKSGYRDKLLIPYTDHFELMCLPSTPKGTATIDSGKGVKIQCLYYFHPKFRDPKYAGRKVPVRYDPFDISKGFAFLDGEWLPCESEYASLFRHRTEREIQIITGEIRGKNKRAGKRRIITGEQIAKYIMSLESSEKVLLQRKKDAEYKAANKPDVKEELPSTSDDRDVAAYCSDLWKNFTARNLERLDE